jgi:thiol-disulfide isomerase/thioredoxin
MDRLPLVTMVAALVAAAVSCRQPADKPAAETQRVNAVAALPPEQRNAADFCDVSGGQQPFAYPDLMTAPRPLSTGQWRWVNIWATWCKPCTEELPRLLRWQQRLADDNVQVALQLISVDERAEQLAAYADQQAAQISLRVRAPDRLDEWTQAIGLGANAAIPIHVFVDPKGAIQCVRAAGIGDPDYGLVRDILRGQLAP